MTGESGERETERAVWRAAVALLPEAEVAAVEEWADIGEQEAAIEAAIRGLCAHGVAIGGELRAGLSVVAELWGCRQALADRLDRCAGAADDVSTLRVLPPSAVEPLPIEESVVQRAAAGGELAPEAGTAVVPWIVCEERGWALDRLHVREPWGELSFHATGYLLRRPAEPEQALFRGPLDAWNALLALRQR
ncbi:hypothetical protein MTQ01_20580 [Streptomyces sp. XM4193]|uniref:hypothetical protein n=1 Tax=Streptomyces sp. XM4193 TaxID=2929782 RepID=UPI001FFBC853|nr:hypothetical protein [Streptomyces sp. XM4193]MCK1798378.1 hypothetical protein [Streptomyces sp. XM4193]